MLAAASFYDGWFTSDPLAGRGCQPDARGVGSLPGSLDIVITWVNLTDPNPAAHAVRADGACGLYPGQGACDPASGTPCCEGGHCRAAPRLRDCACPTCVDHRLRAPARTFLELKWLLRSLEKYGLRVRSPEAPRGVVRHIFVAYNDQAGRAPPPAWLDGSSEYLTAVPYTAIWKDPSAGLPTRNRNAIEAALHRIPGLGEWFLWLEDDMFLVSPWDAAAFVRPDGRIATYRNLPILYNISDPWLGMMYENHAALLAPRFGPRLCMVGGAHVPSLLNKCVLGEMEALWPERYAKTAAHADGRRSDVSVGSVLFDGYMEGRGFAVNFPRYARLAREIHMPRDSAGPEDLCAFWDGATMFAQVQGPGVSDEFKEPASGDVRLSWERWLAATFPEPTRFERSESVAAEAALQRLLAPQGREMCAQAAPSLRPPGGPVAGSAPRHRSNIFTGIPFYWVAIALVVAISVIVVRIWGATRRL